MSTSATPATPLWTPSFALLTAAHCLQALGYASMFLVPVYLDHVGASRTEIGAVMATASVSGILVRPVVAWALDRVGKKVTLVFGTLVLAAGMLLMPLVDGVGTLIYLDRILVGIGTGALFSGYFALANDLVPSARRTEGLALFGVSGLMPLLINPLAPRLGYAPAELPSFFLGLGLLVLGSLLPLAWVRGPPATRDPPPFSARAIGRALLQRPLWRTWLSVLGLSTLASVFMSFATVVAGARGMTDPTSLWFGYAGGAAVVRVGLGRVADRWGPSVTLPLAFFLWVAAALLVALSPPGPGILAAGLLAGLGHGIGFPVLAAEVMTRMPPDLRGTGMTTMTTLWEMAALGATPVFGGLADVTSDETMFVVLAAVALWVIPVARGRPPRARPAQAARAARATQAGSSPGSRGTTVQ